MKFIYKIPHGYFPGGAYFKYAPTVNASAWSANNLLVCVMPRDTSLGGNMIQGETSQTEALTTCSHASLPDIYEIDSQ